jgi:molybdate transport system permease protein
VSAEAVLKILTDPATIGPLWLSFKVSLVAVPVLLVLGVGIGLYLSDGRSRIRSIVDFLVSLPLVFPPIATGFLLLLLFGRNGPLGRMLGELFDLQVIFGFWGVAMAGVVAGLPLMVKPVQTAVDDKVRRYVETASVLGKSKIQILHRVLLPSIRKSILAGLFLSWGRSLGEVGITLMLGGNIIGRTNTVSLEIYNAVFTGEYVRAMVLAVLLGLVALALISGLRRLGAV